MTKATCPDCKEQMVSKGFAYFCEICDTPQIYSKEDQDELQSEELKYHPPRLVKDNE